jgi:hypothetical protein
MLRLMNPDKFIIHQKPVEKPSVIFAFNEGDAVTGGVSEMNSMQSCLFRETVRDGGEGFVDGHGLERTAEFPIAVDANVTELLRSQ